MVRRLDLEGWRRRDHFRFFKGYEQPFFNVCTEVDVSSLVDFAGSERRSFFLAILYLSLAAANDVPEMRLRIRGDDVVEHDVVHGGSTVLRDDDTFGFAYFDFGDGFATFEQRGRVAIDTVRRGSSLEDQPERDDLVYFSVLPWFSFTSFSHARRVPPTETNPRIVFGKREGGLGGSWRMPVSVEVHHALVDGIHVARFLERFAGLLRQPGPALG
jgi:chloramphenicol O-acetyltransferase type A